VGVEVGGTGVGVEVGSAGAPPHPASNNTSAVTTNICGHGFLLFIALFLSLLEVVIVPDLPNLFDLFSSAGPPNISYPLCLRSNHSTK
jgi:hypothetical protein